MAMTAGLAAAVLVGLVRNRLDDERNAGQAVTLPALFSPRAVAAPFAMLAADRDLLTIACLAFSFAVVQGSLFSFSVTYLVTARGLSLGDAAFAYAAMQGSGAVARVALGWLADRTGRPARNLAIQAIMAAAFVVLYGALPDRSPLWLAAVIAGATGFVATSWNGIFMAEVARLSPTDRVAELTASSTLCAFLGYVAGPSLFSLLVTWTGGYFWSFLTIALQLFCMALVQFGVGRRLGAPLRNVAEPHDLRG